MSISEGTSKRKRRFGFDLDVRVPHPGRAVFLPKRDKYQPFWKTWGCRIIQRSWKRTKVFNRAEYLTILFALTPGLWFFKLYKFVIEHGGGHVLQVALLCIIVSVPLLYAQTFLADYTKMTYSKYWSAMPLTYCFLPMQIIGCVIESLLGMTISTLYLSRFVNTILWRKSIDNCPEYKLDNLICYDNKIHAISQRCKEGGVWVTCPDNSTYALSSQLFFKSECSVKDGLSSWDVLYISLHWLFITYIGFKGIRNFVKIIRRTLFLIVFIHLIFLIMTISSNPLPAIKGMSKVMGVKMKTIISIDAWKNAFVVAIDIALWSLPSNTAVAAGLVFRTSRWNDSMLVVIVAFFVSVFFICTNYSVIGNIAYQYNTRIEVIWKPRGVDRGDTMLTTFMKDFSLGSIFMCLNYICFFAINIWVHGCLAETLVLMLAELCNKLEHQTSILVGYIVVCFPVSVYYAQFAQCDVTSSFPLSKSFQSIRLMNGTAFAVLCFWLYGKKKISEDHMFMYGHEPINAVVMMWTILPGFFIVVIIVDIIQNIIETTIYEVVVAYSVYIGVSVFSLIILIWLNMITCKRPFYRLVEPPTSIAPPNAKLRAVRKTFNPSVGKGMLAWSPADARARRRQLPPPEERLAPDMRRTTYNFRRRELLRRSRRRPTEERDISAVALRSLHLAEDVDFYDLCAGAINEARARARERAEVRAQMRAQRLTKLLEEEAEHYIDELTSSSSSSSSKSTL